MTLPSVIVEVFRLRCASRAKLWHTGQIDLHSAVDELQHSAEASGLIDPVGQDAVQGLMVEAFAPLRDDLPRAEKKQPPADVSIERAWDKIDPNDRAAASTVEALMLALRERGADALAEGPVRQRLVHLDRAQVLQVGDRLQRLQPHIANAWTPPEVQQLFAIWGRLRR